MRFEQKIEPSKPSKLEQMEQEKKTVELRNNERIILEIACGKRPYFVQYNETIGKNTHYIGIDLPQSLKNAALLKKTLSEEQEGKIDFVIGSGESLPFRDKQADIIVLSNFFSAPPGPSEHLDTTKPTFESEYWKLPEARKIINKLSDDKEEQQWIAQIITEWEKAKRRGELFDKNSLNQLARNSSKTKREFFKIFGPFIIEKLEKGIPELISERIIKTGVVKEIARVLKPGSDLIIYETSGNWTDAKPWIEMLEQDSQFQYETEEYMRDKQDDRVIIGMKWIFRRR
jgi:ubiquinone/menaquinone biosynthesis C-methylase UbiE